MGVAGESIEHPSDLAKVPGRIIERRMVRVFSFRTCLTEECFEMVHYAEPGSVIWVLVNKAQKSAIFFYENCSCGREVLTDFLGDAELRSIMSDGYNAYVFIGDELKSARFKDTVHQVCMSHAKNKFVKASNLGGEPTAERFSNILKEFFMRERKCDEAGHTPEERLRERQSLETKELLIELRSLLDSELNGTIHCIMAAMPVLRWLRLIIV